ncbi:sugar transferase [Candidatus Gracilibacteria bacterium]|nr:sugar transferase [Candidatus Gracilibacteria bacterium]
MYKLADDPRMTRVGKFLEKTSLDELPQFFNVMKGDMSIVGPRPHQPREVKKYRDEHFKVLNIKPGITGMAQVNGRSDLTFEKEVFYDKYYVEHWSFWLDLWIIVKTPFVILFKRQKS